MHTQFFPRVSYHFPMIFIEIFQNSMIFLGFTGLIFFRFSRSSGNPVQGVNGTSTLQYFGNHNRIRYSQLER